MYLTYPNTIIELYAHTCLVLWNMFSHSVGNVIIPTDELSRLSRGQRFKMDSHSGCNIGQLLEALPAAKVSGLFFWGGFSGHRRIKTTPPFFFERLMFFPADVL